MSINISVVTPSMTSTSGGVGPAILELYKNLVVRNNDLHITVKSLRNSGGDLTKEFGEKRLSFEEYDSIFSETLGLSPQLILSAWNDKNIIHAHGLWMMTSIYQNLAFSLRRNPFIISPHGMLDPWILSRGKLKKKMAKMFYESYSWNKCAKFHALTTFEADSIKVLIPDAKIEVIPNGIDVNNFNHSLKNLNAKRVSDCCNILFLGRFHEKKNVHSLIDAINSIPDDIYKKNRFKLVLAGWGENSYIDLLQKKISEGNKNRFEYIGPAFGDKKKELFRSASCFILPSFSEGLPVSVLEAWSYALPVLMTKNCNLPESFLANAAIEVETSVKSIANEIINFISLNESEKLDLEKNSLCYVKDNYSWDIVCEKFVELYKGLNG